MLILVQIGPIYRTPIPIFLPANLSSSEFLTPEFEKIELSERCVGKKAEESVGGMHRK